MSKFFSFLSSFGSEKVKEGQQGVMKFLVSFDPKTASAAQIKMIEDKRDDYARKLVKARQALQKDIEETAEVQSQIDRSKQALFILKERHDKGDEGAMSQAREVAESIKKLEVELEREKNEDEQAKQLVDSIQQVYDAITNKLKTEESSLKEAERRMEKAKSDREHQAMLDEMNGDLGAFEGMNVVLDAMNAEADKAEQDAEVMRMNARSSKDKGSNLVDELLAENAGKAKDESDPFAILG